MIGGNSFYDNKRGAREDSNLHSVRVEVVKKGIPNDLPRTTTFYNFDLKQKVHSGLCIVFLLLVTFWVVLKYSVTKAYSLEKTLSVKSADRYTSMEDW